MASKQAQRSRKSANSTSSSTTLSSKHFLETSIDGAQSSPAMSAAIGAELSPKEIRQGEEIAWYADGDTIVRNEQNPSITYAYDRVYGPTTTTHHVYEVAAQHIVNGAMEGITSTIFAYAVTSSGKTHTMHGDQRSSGIIPLAVKDAFTIIQETPCREFLLRVSYIEIYSEVVNDLLNPAGQNLRIREDHQIVDEKSLIKKYQNEIRLLKEELERLKNGTVSVRQPKGIGGQDIVLLKQNLAYLPPKRRDLILEDGNIDLYITHDGNSEFADDTSREEKSRKNGFLNWIKIRTQGGQMCFKL